jgi:primase-polymerase (primpol)-like protein
MRECEYCGKSIVRKNAQARYCSDHCRNYARRAMKRDPIPAALTERGRWIRYSDPIRKIPLTVTGRVASSTNPATWASYEEAKASTAGSGLGFVLGDGIGCIDIDHCLAPDEPSKSLERFLEPYRDNYIEISPSGDGLHIWGNLDEQPGKRYTADGLSIEKYSTGRYITITGNVYQHGSLRPL